jgi:hypothetical protein
MAPPKQTETETQVVAALQGIGQVLQQIAAEVAALRVLLDERLGSPPPEPNYDTTRQPGRLTAVNLHSVTCDTPD